MNYAQSGMEIGIYTLGDLVPEPDTGKTIPAGQRLKEIVEAAKLADEAGLDVFGVGEHHRLDYVASTPPVILAAASQVTKRVKLVSTTTVLGTVDPVRLFEDFATLDLLSDGRAEVIAGRGAFVESFSLFGYNLDDYDGLFDENIDLFLKLNAQKRVTWSGRFRSPLKDAEIAPRPAQKEIPFWVGVGGSPESAERAGKYGVGLTMAILGGAPERFTSLVERYRQSAAEAGHPISNLKVAVTGHAYISSTNEQAKDEYYPYYANYRQFFNREHSVAQMSRSEFEQLSGPDTALFVGSSQQIIEKILYQYELFGHQRFLAQLDIGGMPFKKVAENIERLAVEVAPVVRRETRKLKK
ncbi:LLM class flavin-dependent oxidoreductase [Neobacillus thermocopriae]|uniref:LLM class flavin-dependent oxidoreductase n=1 Tax=Neobacillus thermocopriae TaxID=1215031 RepID=UPI002E1FB4CC|nr:LLM class flavin-dependent oxidoreductase [Neobacillus thermocopriae]MED3622586.1 LLM class flavin-dependent oxidoreductase [Neobacillus thermocopriae]MED3714323.1 LLM class flavin-dependent oxidoreductase [Neobacillus thermocopriae]